MRPLLCALTIAMASVPASAAAQTSVLPPNIAGLWVFEADLPELCSFDGQARLTPTSDPAVFGCELTARQDCPAAGVTYVVEQSCRASIEDNTTVIIQSEIRTFLEGEPTPAYTPDDFELRIQDGSTLIGLLHGHGRFPALWRRADGAIS